MAHQKIRFTKSAECSQSARNSTNGRSESIFLTDYPPNYELLFEFAKEKNCLVVNEEELKQDDDNENRLKLTKTKTWDSLKVPERSQSMRHVKSSTSPRSSSMQRTYTTKVAKEKQTLQLNSSTSPSSSFRQGSAQSPATTPTDDDITRLRTFIIDPKAGLINRGDSFRCRNNNTTMSSSESVPCLNGSRSSSISSRSPSPYPVELTVSAAPPQTTDDVSVAKYKVLVIGSEGVGKTVLINQFKTSEYCNLFNNDSVDRPDDEQNTSVSIVLDGEESELCFTEVDNEKDKKWQEQDSSGYLIVYSVDKETSFRNAVNVLKEISDIMNKSVWKPIVLVGNKVDLERRRYVSKEEAKHVAEEHECKFVEISVAIGHNVDKLLAGILSQIRRKREDFVSDSEEIKTKKREKLKLCASRSHTTSNVGGLAAAKRQLISKLSFKQSKTSKSVEDLFSSKKN